MPGSTPKGVPYSLGTDTADTIDNTMQALAEWMDARPGVSALTTVQRDALAAVDKWDGRIIWNTTDARLQRYNAGTATWLGVVVADSDKLGGMSAPLYLLTTDANAAYGLHSCRATMSANQSVPSGTWTALALAAADTWDTDGYHDPAVNNTRLTIPANLAGKYLFPALIDFGNVTVGWRAAALVKNGSDYVGYYGYGVNAENGEVMLTSALPVDAAVGDYFELYAYHTRGSALDVLASGTFLSCIFLGA